MRIDSRAIVSAAYSGGTEDSWLLGLAQAALGEMGGVFAYRYEARDDGGASLHKPVQVGDVPPVDGWWPLLSTWAEEAPPNALRLVYRPARPVQSLRRMCESPALQDSGLGERFRRYGLADITTVCCYDPSGHGIVFGYPGSSPRHLSPHTVRGLSRAAAHVAAAHRLRRQGTPESDCVLTPRGAVEDAQGLSNATLSRLREAVRHREHALGQPLSSADALSEWSAMIAERWSLVDHFDHDGKRYVLARRNSVEGPAEDLSAAERQVVAYVALGHSDKYIAYELGISPSSVRTRLASAMRRLGLRSRRDLIARIRALAQQDDPLA